MTSETSVGKGREAQLKALLTMLAEPLQSIDSQLEAVASIEDLIIHLKNINLGITKTGKSIRKGSVLESEFLDMREVWSKAKSMALLKALRWRKQGRDGILVDAYLSNEPGDINQGKQERLVFRFKRGNGHFFNATATANLAQIVGAEALKDLIGEFDYFDFDRSPRLRK